MQRQLATRVVRRAPRRAPRRFVGLDAAFSPDGRSCIAAAVVWDAGERRVIEERVARAPLRFPYVPGLLSFREGPALLAALRRLRTSGDALMLDGHGLAHPRRLGIASHLGVITDLPAVGCAKSRLVGRHDEPGPHVGDTALLLDGDEVIGRVLRTREGVRPIYVSIGHRVDLDRAVEWVLGCCGGFRLPEPTRRADRLVGEVKRRERPPRRAPRARA